MGQRPAVQVIVAGGGVVGLVTALGLGRAGWNVLVCEARDDATAAMPDIIYHWSVMQVFAHLGVLNTLMAAGTVTDRIHVYFPSSAEHFDIEADLLHTHPYWLVLPREAIREVLLNHLRSMANVRVERSTFVDDVEQSDDGVAVVLTDGRTRRTERAEWVVGADGAGSRVRRSVGLSLPGTTWPQQLVWSTIAHDMASLGFGPVSYCVDPRLGGLIAPADSGQRTWQYAFVEPSGMDPATAVARARHRLRQLLPDQDGLDVLRTAVFPLHERCADEFARGRAVLVGSAAHVTNPVSGFAMATGIGDAYAISHALDRVRNAGANPETVTIAARRRRTMFRTLAAPLSAERLDLVFNQLDATRRNSEYDLLRQGSRDAAAGTALLADGDFLAETLPRSA